MDKAAKERLRKAGFFETTVASFLALTPEEEPLVEACVALTRRLRQVRIEQELTQKQVACLIGSNQSRVAKMESADRTVSIDLMVWTLFRLGQTPRQVGRALAG
jgi:DNA-binding XRE family transcriptional regulator